VRLTAEIHRRRLGRRLRNRERGDRRVDGCRQSGRSGIPVRERGQELAAFLDRVGPQAACVLIQCTDEQTGRTVAARATERGSECWHDSRTAFLALLHQVGDNYDWLRPAVAEPTSKRGRRARRAKKSLRAGPRRGQRNREGVDETRRSLEDGPATDLFASVRLTSVLVRRWAAGESNPGPSD
jgi:plasmid stabilization system protein ParE